MGRKKTTNYYWTDDTERGIIRYNTTDRASVKNKIYNDHLVYPFFKLTENIINTFKFSYFDDSFVDVQNECISFIVLNMHKYDHEKGSKAFSYFSVVIKNYLILNNNANYKKLKSHKNIDNAKNVHTIQKNEDANTFIEETINYFEDKASAQVKTSICFAALNTPGETIIKCKKSRNHTELLFEYLKIPIKIKKTKQFDFIKIKGKKEISSFNYTIPADISSSAFFIVLTALSNNSKLLIKNVNINPSRTGVIKILKKMGVIILIKNKKKI